MTSGIYEIKNILNNYRYIGSSVNVYKRFKEHLNLLNNDKHHSFILQRDWNKYGSKVFIFKILEECEPIKNTLLFVEQKYLDLNPEYNICKNARNSQGVVFTDSRKRKIGEANHKRIIKDSTRLKHKINSINSNWNKKQRKQVIMYDLDKNYLRTFNSICEAAIYTGHINHRVGIKRVLKGLCYKAYGYIWELKK